MEEKPYPEEKRRILVERGTTDFVAFLEDVTDPVGKHFIRDKLLQRQVPGFRPGHARLNQTVPILISKLKREQELTNPNSPIWDLFKKSWVHWVGSHRELNDILLEFDNTADFNEHHQCIAPPNSQLDHQCFEVLLEANGNNQIDQETIRCFYEYGYFNKDEQIEELIDKALPHEEIERRRRLAELPNLVDKLRHEIDELRTQIFDLEPINELEQVLGQQIASTQKSFENQLHELSQQVSEVQRPLENQISESNFTQTISLLRQLITSLESRIVEVEKSLPNTQPATTEFINTVDEKIAKLDQQIQDTSQSVEERLEAVNSDVSEIKSTVEKQNQSTDKRQVAYETLKIGERYAAAPRIAHRALGIGERYAAKLEEENEHYEDENDYLRIFQFSLRRFGVTESDETASAFHIALKAFPVLEIADTRIIKVWDLMCDNHFHLTRITVEMGWLGLQDWFPDFFADECFGERLERINLDISVRKMLEMGDMLWAIHFSNCDRSFPEGYLPSFIKWINDFSNNTIKVFLTRCLGTNRCEINEDVYAWTARLPEPEEQEPIEAQNLRPSGAIVTQSEWESWCCPNADVNLPSESQLVFLEQLRSTIEKSDVYVPILLLREIQHYVRLSHNLLAPTRALDWALKLRFLPWVENQPKVIDSILNMLSQENDELQHFYKGLQQTREKINESN